MTSDALYTIDQVHQIVEEVLHKLDRTDASSREAEHLDSSIPQQSSPGTKLTLSVREAADMIGISKPTMYGLIRNNEIPVIHVGKKIIITRQALLDWLSEGENHGKKAC